MSVSWGSKSSNKKTKLVRKLITHLIKRKKNEQKNGALSLHGAHPELRESRVPVARAPDVGQPGRRRPRHRAPRALPPLPGPVGSAPAWKVERKLSYQYAEIIRPILLHTEASVVVCRNKRPYSFLQRGGVDSYSGNIIGSFLMQ